MSEPPPLPRHISWFAPWTWKPIHMLVLNLVVMAIVWAYLVVSSLYEWWRSGVPFF